MWLTHALLAKLYTTWLLIKITVTECVGVVQTCIDEAAKPSHCHHHRTFIAIVILLFPSTMTGPSRYIFAHCSNRFESKFKHFIAIQSTLFSIRCD